MTDYREADHAEEIDALAKLLERKFPTAEEAHEEARWVVNKRHTGGRVDPEF